MSLAGVSQANACQTPEDNVSNKKQCITKIVAQSKRSLSVKHSKLNWNF